VPADVVGVRAIAKGEVRSSLSLDGGAAPPPPGSALANRQPAVDVAFRTELFEQGRAIQLRLPAPVDRFLLDRDNAAARGRVRK
jgi:hypothetical protein